MELKQRFLFKLSLTQPASWCVLIWLLCWGETRHLTMSEVTCMGYCIYNVVCMCVSVLLWRPFASCVKERRWLHLSVSRCQLVIERKQKANFPTSHICKSVNFVTCLDIMYYCLFVLMFVMF